MTHTRTHRQTGMNDCVSDTALRDSEQLYRSLVEHAPDAMFVHCDGTIVYANAAAAGLFGAATPDALLGLNAFERVHPDWRGVMHARATAVSEPGGAVPLLEGQMLRLDGTAVDTETIAAGVRYNGAAAVQVVLRDITGRRRAEATQRQSEALVQLCVKHAPAAVAMVDRHMRYLAVSDRWLVDYGLAGETVLGRTHYELFPELPQAWKDIHQRVLAGGCDRCDEAEFLRADGRREWLRWEVVPWYGEAGSVGGLIMFTEVITARKELEIAVRDSEARFRQVLETVRAPALWLDLDGKVTFANDALLSLTGWSSDELLGADWFLQCVPNGAAIRPMFVAHIATEEIPAHFEAEVLTRAGETRLLAWDNNFRRDPAGELLGTSSIGRDVTQQRAVEEAGRIAREAAEASTRAKSDFVANMSHEIRTPMNGVVGMLELALGGTLLPEQREFLEIARSSADSLLTVLNDILDFSKIEAGRLELSSAPLELRDVIADAARIFALAADKKGLELIPHVSHSVPETLAGDPGRLRQVIVNLIGNAIKFTNVGEIVVSVDVLSPTETSAAANSDKDAITIHVSVRDTGMGIAPDKRDQIFGAFQQADSSTTREFGGTGLGLAISSQLVGLMGGRLWVDSEVGRGSTFHFTAVLRRQGHFPMASEVTTIGSRHLPAGTRVLVVDDNATSRHTLSTVLGALGTRVVAVDAADAVATMRQAHSDGQSFALVLLDAHMPGLDGFAVLERMREHMGSQCAVVMMLSASGQHVEGARCRALGVHAYLPKPIHAPELLRVIREARRHMAKGAATVQRSANGGELQGGVTIAVTANPLRVLLVDDNAVNRRLAAGLLERRGHAVTLAGNGQVALGALETGTFDVVLMDVHMPVLGGFEATRKIRSLERGTSAHLPVVAMTASAMLGDRERCLAAGMDGYVTKPILSAELFEVVERLALGGAVWTAPTRAAATAAPKADDEDPIDRSALRHVTGNDAELMRDLLQLFQRGIAEHQFALRLAAGESDLRALESAAHAVKGASGAVGGTRAYKAALALETLARDGRVGDIDGALLTLETALAHLDRALCSSTAVWAYVDATFIP
ncbi:MAG: PAS domain S-box protein [Phycisphaerae bacterium]|nr:PAS domain S-box protein [Gemmatimonadaceae bacterium]